MKKALIVIISAIYLVAIIIVAFLGSRAEITNETIYAQEIVLKNESVYYPGTDDAHKTEENMIIGVYKRPDESIIDPVTGKDSVENINWNYDYNEDEQKFEGRRDYAIFVYDTFWLDEEMRKSYTPETEVLPEETSKKELTYSIGGGSAGSTLTINNDGVISFSVEYTSWVFTDIEIRTTDGSKIKLDILLTIKYYE